MAIYLSVLFICDIRIISYFVIQGFLVGRNGTHLKGACESTNLVILDSISFSRFIGGLRS